GLTLNFLPRLSYVLYTPWGIMLLIKTGLVVLVLLTAGMLHWLRRKRKNNRIGVALSIDLGLAGLIVAIAAVFTFLSPAPPNEPLYWHVMGEDIHMTAEITPNTPGANAFSVKVWLPEQIGEPKKVQMLLIPGSSGDDAAPLEVPLEPDIDPDEPNFFPGFHRYDYKAEGPYLPYPGQWHVQIRVMDPNDNETVYDYDMRIY